MNLSQVEFAQRFGVRFDTIRSVGPPAGDRTRARSGRARLRAARCRVNTEPQATHNKSARAAPKKRTEYFHMYQAHRRAQAARLGIVRRTNASKRGTVPGESKTTARAVTRVLSFAASSVAHREHLSAVMAMTRKFGHERSQTEQSPANALAAPGRCRASSTPKTVVERGTPARRFTTARVGPRSSRRDRGPHRHSRLRLARLDTSSAALTYPLKRQ
jgi:hypothetical protein